MKNGKGEEDGKGKGRTGRKSDGWEGKGEKWVVGKGTTPTAFLTNRTLPVTRNF